MSQNLTQNRQSAAQSERTPSKGERAFDWLVYGGMNYVGTFILTIPVAYSMKFGLLKNSYNSCHEWLMNRGLSSGWATKLLDTTTLSMGGNLMVVPIKILEDNKRGIVDGLNKQLGDDGPNAKNVEDAPKQDWLSLLKSRVVAWGVVFASFTGADWLMKGKFGEFSESFGRGTNRMIKAPFHKNVPEALQADAKLYESLAEQITQKGADKTALRSQMAELTTKLEPFETRRFAYGKLGAVDVFATAAAVSLLYAGSRIFSKPREADGAREAASIKSPTRITVRADEATTGALAMQDVAAQQPAGKAGFAERLAQEKEQAGHEQARAI